ncbi:hypothetical protein SM033_00267 [Vibrio phage vB_VpaM_sm033]|nr:hypothetical protein SM033_00267 [Vibrio phage vB_VpaM_sm033]
MRLTNGQVLVMGILSLVLFFTVGQDNTEAYNNHVMETTTHQE